MFFAGCTSEKKGTTESLDQTDYTQFTIKFHDTYAKCSYTTHNIDAEDLAKYFKPDLDDYIDKTEVFDNGTVKRFVEDGTIYEWKQNSIAGSINFAGHLSDKDYGDTLTKAKQYIKEWSTQLNIELEVDELHETDGISECRYRQIVDGVPISTMPSGIDSVIRVDVGKYSGLQIDLCCIIDELKLIETYETKDFLSLEKVDAIVEQYINKEVERFGLEPNIEVTIQSVEITYYIVDAHSGSYIKPIYEIDVIENNGRFDFHATYAVDVLTGYVEYRLGDYYWF